MEILRYRVGGAAWQPSPQRLQTIKGGISEKMRNPDGTGTPTSLPKELDQKPSDTDLAAFKKMSRRIHEMSTATMQKPERKPRRKYRNYQKGILTPCIRGWKDWPCQFLVGERVFCMLDKPCWKAEEVQP